MNSVVRPASSSLPTAADRIAPAVWAGIIVLGIVVGFGLDFSRFLGEQPPPALIIHIHAVVFASWLVLLCTQICLVLRGRMSSHRLLGAWGAWLAIAMSVLGLATALSVRARQVQLGHTDRVSFLAVNIANIAGFLILVVAGLSYRHRPEAHRRLMILATVALADLGFARISQFVVAEPTQFWSWFLYTYYGNVVVIAAMVVWDLWRSRRIHPALVLGAALLITTELGATALYFDPNWKQLSIQIARAWGYSGISTQSRH